MHTNFRLEAIKKYPETVVKTVDHGVHYFCASCHQQLDKHGLGVLGKRYERISMFKSYYLNWYNIPRCPDCGANPVGHDTKALENMDAGSKLVIHIPPIKYLRFRKLEHFTKVRRTWWGKEIFSDSVIELVKIPGEKYPDDKGQENG